jgi:hypothetical protein
MNKVVNSTSAAFSAANDKIEPFASASDKLIATFKNINARYVHPDLAEREVKQAFLNFLREMNFPLAERNYAALLNEKSGRKSIRDDGTVNWYHELVPIVMLIEMGRLGKDAGGFDLKDIDAHGGLEVAICTHLRHDSIEDFTSKRKFVYELKRLVQDIVQSDPNADVEKLKNQYRQILINTNMMTQKKVKLLPDTGDGSRYYKNKHGDLIEVEANAKFYIENGLELVKEDVTDYTGEMVYGPQANPIVFLLKQLDVVHNFSTMFSPKFSAERRLKRCNEREDMYGGRSAFPENAMQKWPEFANAIATADAHMATMLFTHFRLLQDVDLYYKKPNRFPIGLAKYRDNTFRLPMVEMFDTRHNLVNNLIRMSQTETDPARKSRLVDFIENKFSPALGEYITHFPQLATRRRGQFVLEQAL